LQARYDAFKRRDVAVIAVAHEDKNLTSHATLPAKIEPKPRFEIVADIGREATQRYDRTTAYYIDKAGRVRQVFPMMIRSRPSWEAVLAEIDRLQRQ